jgi:hypothetical protein
VVIDRFGVVVCPLFEWVEGVGNRWVMVRSGPPGLRVMWSRFKVMRVVDRKRSTLEANDRDQIVSLMTYELVTDRPLPSYKQPLETSSHPPYLYVHHQDLCRPRFPIGIEATRSYHPPLATTHKAQLDPPPLVSRFAKPTTLPPSRSTMV